MQLRELEIKSTPPRPPLKTNAAPIQPVTKKTIEDAGAPTISCRTMNKQLAKDVNELPMSNPPNESLSSIYASHIRYNQSRCTSWTGHNLRNFGGKGREGLDCTVFTPKNDNKIILLIGNEKQRHAKQFNDKSRRRHNSDGRSAQTPHR